MVTVHKSSSSLNMNSLLIFSHLFTSLLAHSFCGCLIPNLRLTFYSHLFPVFSFPSVTLLLFATFTCVLIHSHFYIFQKTKIWVFDFQSEAHFLLVPCLFLPRITLSLSAFFVFFMHQNFTILVCIT